MPCWEGEDDELEREEAGLKDEDAELWHGVLCELSFECYVM